MRIWSEGKGCGRERSTWTIRGGGSIAVSTGAIGNVVEMCLNIYRAGLKVSRVEFSKPNHLSTSSLAGSPLLLIGVSSAAGDAGGPAVLALWVGTLAAASSWSVLRKAGAASLRVLVLVTGYACIGDK